MSNLKHALKNAIKHGPCTLSSGAQSTFFLDALPVTLSPHLYDIACKLHALMERPSYVCGPSSGADPLVASLVLLGAIRRQEVNGLLYRKDGKLEGPLKSGGRCYVVEDVTTTGTQALKAAMAAQRVGLEVVGVLTVVDREDGARERVEKEGLSFASLFKIGELL